MIPATYLRALAYTGRCPRRQVAAIITDVHGQFLSQGVNGPPLPLVCDDGQPCAGRHQPKGDSSLCLAIHAEVYAIVNCPDLRRAQAIYVSSTPCFACAKLILATPIREVWADEVYADSTGMTLLAMNGVSVHLSERTPHGEKASNSEIDLNVTRHNPSDIDDSLR